MKKFRIHPSFYLLILFAIILGLTRDLFLILLVLLIHEVGHYFFIKLFDCKINKTTIFPFGGIIDYQHKNDFLFKEILISLGGIIFNFLFFKLFLLFKFYNIAHLNFFFFVINILPILPLDGGRFFLFMISYIFPYRMSKIISHFLSIFLSLFLIIYFVYYFSGIYLLLFLTLFIKINIDALKNLRREYNHFILIKHLYPNLKFREKTTRFWTYSPIDNIFYQKIMTFDYESFKISEKEILLKYFSKQKTGL